jgi:Bacterial Ig-like domain (group 2)
MKLAISVKSCGFGLALLLVGIGAAQTAPQTHPQPVVACTSILRPAVAVTVKNERGQVLNALEERYYTPRAAKQMSIRPDGSGSWMVSVHRRWYKPVTIRGVRVQEDECGLVRPTPLTVRLEPTPDAPRVREFSVFPASVDGFFVGSWPFYQRYVTFLDAPSSVSREVVWSSSNPAVATIDQSGMLRSVCNRTPARTTLTATLKADSSVTVSTRFGRGGGGMVCKRGAVDR